jgi:hypothetical protein
MEQDIFEHRRLALKPFVYLPLFYMIPDEIAQKRKLDSFPRDPYYAATTPEWIEMYNSKWFQVMLMDTWGWMMWQSLGIRGGVDNYSTNDPFVRTVFTLPMWAWLLAEQGINTDMLAGLPMGAEIPLMSMELSAHNCGGFAEYFWNHPILKMREVYKIVKKHRDHRDYSGMPSHVKIDFQRSYYHTRAETKVIPDTDKDGEPIYAPHYPNEFAEVETRLWFDGFLSRFNEKDREIARLTEEGYTQKEVAIKLGYANHSAVSKRIKFMYREFQKFRQEEREWDKKTL